MDILELFDDAKIRRHPGFFNAWLVRDEVTVGLLHGRFLAEPIPAKDENHSGFNAGLSSRYFETRAGYQNQGVATQLITMVKNYFNTDEMIHSGCFTPQGHSRLLSKLDSPSWYENTGEPELVQMVFVDDWDRRVKRGEY